MASVFLPPPVPIGSAAEYQETILGQWQQVDTPDSSKPVLEIPVASQIIQPTGVPFEFDVYDAGGGPCDLSVSCTCVAHEVNTGAFIQIGGADIPPGVSNFDCLSWAEGPGACQSGADNLNGLPLGSTFPAWFLHILGLDPNTPMSIDYWTIVCDPVQIVIPNWTPPPRGVLCPIGDAAVGTAGACPVGFFADPSAPGCCKPNVVDPPTPRGIRNLSGLTVGLSVIPPQFRQGFRARLDTTGLHVPAPGPRLPPPAVLLPALPAGAEMPLPPGNCGCLHESEEMAL